MTAKTAAGAAALVLVGILSGVSKWLRPLCVKLGVKFTPHRARHSFATWLIEEGAELLDIMEAGGWKDIKSVARYGRPSQDRLRSVINRIGGKLGG